MSIPVIDFKGLNVLAVTRCCDEMHNTRITYVNVGIHYLYVRCSNEEHDKLALKFEDYLYRMRDNK